MGTISTHRRTGSLILAAALTAAFLVFPTTAAHAASPTLLTSESFNTHTVADPNWKTGGTAYAACLTASTNTTQAPIPGCANGAVALPAGGDPTSNGTLRLTENVGNQVGYGLYDVPLPFTKGIQVTFDQYQYAGTSADGIGFFLADGSAATFAPGQPGGSFGYAQRSGAVGTPSGYLGLAIDAYGNFANDNENRGTNCTVAEGKSPHTGTKPNTITLRGPGSGLNKYCWLATSATLTPALRTAGPTRTAAKTKQGIRITIDPATNKVTVDRNMYDGSGYTNLLTTTMPPAPPTTVKFGFIASTGGSHDIHEIDNVSITSLEQLAALHATIAPASPSYVAGGTGTLNIGVDSVSTEGAGNLPVKVKSVLPTGVTVSSAPTGTGWDCSASSGQNVSCVRSPGPYYYAAGTVFPGISVPVSFASTYSTSTIGISATASADDAAPDYATGVVVVTPQAAADAYPAVGGAATAMNVTSNDKGTLDKTTVSITSPSANGTTSVNATTGVVTFTSSPGFSGVTSFTYQVKDTSGQTTSAVATVTVSPKAYADAVGTAVNTAVTHNPLSNDYGNFTVGSLLVSTAPTHGTAVVQAGGLIKYTPTAGYSGTDTLTYRITDGSTNVNAVVTYTIAPTAGDDAATTPVNVPKQITVLANDVGSLTTASVGVTAAPGHGSTSVSGGKITYTPTSDWSGVDTFTYSASDGTTPVSATVTMTVTPTAANDAATINANATAPTDVLANDHGSLAKSSVTVTTAPAHGTTSVNGTTGVITYAPTTGWSGTDTYTYTATDGAGQPVSATVTVTVNPTAAADSVTRSVTTAGAITFTPLTNDVGSLSSSTFALDGPTVFTTASWDAATGTLTVTQPGGSTASGTWTQGYKICDTAGRCATSSFTLTVTPLAVADSATAAYNTGVGVSVLANDAGSMTSASLTVTGAPTHGSTAVNTTTGVITYTPAVNWSGVDTFTYRGSDGTTTSSAVVTVTTSPKATTDTATTTGRTPVAISVLANDRGTLVSSSVAVTVAPTTGTAVANADGTITYTAPAGFSGTPTFTYSVTDANGTVATAVVTVTVNPDAKNDTATTPAGVPVSVAVLTNDDATPNPATVTVTAFAHGTRSVDATTGAVTYTPAAGWSGDDTATVSYQDTSGRSTSSSLTVTTTPTATDDSATTAEHTAVSVPVLANDKGTFSPSSVTVPASGAGHPAHGSTSVNATTGAITYAPVAEFSGVDTFTYTAKDGANRTVGATVTVTVTPQLGNDTAATTSIASVDKDVLANDHGSLDASTLSVPATSTNGGSVQIVAGKVRYTPLHTFSGTDTVVYTVSDTSSQVRSATLTITVTPVATDDLASASATSPHVTTGVVANDNGNLDPTTVTITSAPAHGTTSVDPVTGAITFHGSAGWSGKTELTYRVCDHAAQCTTAKLALTITPAAGPVAATTPADTAVVIDADAGQTGDFDGTTVSVTVGPLHGSVTVDPVTGDLTYMPATGWSGTDTFTYTIEDRDGQPITVTASVVVTPTATNDTAATPVDVPVDIDVLTNDAGSYTSVEAPAIGQSTGATPHGSVSVNPDLTLHYTPNTGFSGTDTITYLARDLEGRAAAAVVTVTVAPTADADTGTSTGHQSVVLDVLDNDHGSFVPSSVTVPSSGPNAPAHGSVALDPTDGSITYTPAATWSGTDTFVYTACDAVPQCASATVSVITLPDASGDTAATDAGLPVSTTVLANDHGTFVATTVDVTGPAAHGTTAVDAAGAVTYTPAADWSGDDSYTYTAADQEGRTASATVTVTVAPVATDDAASTDTGTDAVIDVLANDDGTFDPSTVTVDTAPNHGTTSIDPSTGEITYSPTANWSGNDVLTYEACDDATRCDTATVVLTVTPTAGDDVATTAVDHPVHVDVLADDHGTLDPSTVTVLTAPQHGTTSIDPSTGGITYDPAANWSGNDVLVYEVCDAATRCASATVTLHVTPAAADDDATTTSNTAVAVDVLDNDHGTVVAASVTVATAPIHGTTGVDGTTGTITYTPATDWSGTDSFTYTATDGAGAVTTASVTVEVKPVATDDAASTTANHAVGIDVLANDHGSLVDASVAVSSPAAHGTTSVDALTGVVTYTPAIDWSGDDTFTYGACDAALSCTSAQVTVHVSPLADDDTASTQAGQPVAVDVLANDHGSLDATSVSVSTPPAHGTTSVDAVTGVVTYTPDADWSGPDTFGYVVTDGAARTATATVTVGTAVVADDESVITDAEQAVVIDVLANDHGVLDPASVTVTADAAFGSTSVDSAIGKVTYTPDAGWSGDDAFSYQVCDAVPTCSTASVSVVVKPTAANDSTSTDPGTAVTTDVLANDHGSLVTSTLSVSVAPAHGTASVDASTGTITYTPDMSFSGLDLVSYTVTDASGRTATAVLGIAVGLVANADSATTPVDTAVTFPVLANDHGTPNPSTISLVTVPHHGSLAIEADGSLTYTPEGGWSGTEHLRYGVCDGVSNCSEADITVVVTPVADADGTDTDTVAGSPIVVDVLGNDHGSLDPTTVSVTGAPTHGTTTVDPTTGKVTYTPDDDWSGDDSFTYEACDSTPTCVSAVVTVHVAPTSSDDSSTTAAGHAVVIDVADNDHGTLDPATTTIVTAPSHGATSVDPATGDIRYTPAAGWSGTDSFRYELCDTAGRCASADVTIHVAPTAADDHATFKTGTDATKVDIDTRTNDVGSFGPSAVTITVDPAHGTATVDPDGVISYVPDGGYQGDDTLSYTVCDVNGDCVSADVTIAVEGLVVTASTRCVLDTPYVDYAVAPVSFTALASDRVTVTWLKDDGTVVATKTDQPTNGRLLWPGTVLGTDGTATAWPGWDEQADGTWVRVDDGLSPNLTLRFSMGATKSLTLAYPRATANCAAAPTLGIEGDNSAAPPADRPSDNNAPVAAGPQALATTGSPLVTAAQLALSLLFAGLVLVVAARRRRTTSAG